MKNYDHDYYMTLALELARQAANEGEIPVGCVIVKDGVVIGRGRNRREGAASALAHAEIEAIAEANKTLGTWRLGDCTMYVTLEPCPMCAGAIINARISRLYYGAKEENSGCCGSILNLFCENFGFSPAITGGIMEAECRKILQDFFLDVRNKK